MMNKFLRIAAIAAVLVVVAIVLAVKQRGQDPAGEAGIEQPGKPAESQPVETPVGMRPTAGSKLPRLVDLGANKCIPCKMMAPILESLKKEYAGRLQVDFIDVWQNPDAGRQYKIGLIPTQIFYDASGKELFRHEGFFSKEEILAKWKELGLDLTIKPAAAISRPEQPWAGATTKVAHDEAGIFWG